MKRHGLMVAEIASLRRHRGKEAQLSELHRELRAAFVRWELRAAHECGERIRQIAPASRTRPATRQELRATVERAIAEAEAEAMQEGVAREALTRVVAQPEDTQ